jgi:hypothetical protein
MHLAGYILIGLVGAAVLAAILAKLRVAVRASRRSGLTEQQFEQSLAAKGVPPEVARAVFGGFRKWGTEIEGEQSDFPLTLELPVSEFTTFVAYDYEDIIGEILSAAGRGCSGKTLPDNTNWTLEDVARFVARCPKHHEKAA